MDANQLGEALARAVEIAKPAQEYCLFNVDHWATCMTKAEWSGWMQAVGSVVAIAVAIWLPYRQQSRAIKQNFIAARQCLIFQCAMVDEIKKATVNQHRLYLASSEPALTLIRMYAGVQSALLPYGAQLPWLAGQTTAGQAKNVISGLKEKKVSPPELARVTEKLMQASVMALEEFDKFDPHMFAKFRRKIAVFSVIVKRKSR